MASSIVARVMLRMKVDQVGRSWVGESPVVINELAAFLVAGPPLLPTDPFALQVRLQRRHLTEKQDILSPTEGSCGRSKTLKDMPTLRHNLSNTRQIRGQCVLLGHPCTRRGQHHHDSHGSKQEKWIIAESGQCSMHGRRGPTSAWWVKRAGSLGRLNTVHGHGSQTLTPRGSTP